MRVAAGPEVYLCEESFVESLKKIVPVNLEIIFSVEGMMAQSLKICLSCVMPD